jgi:signal transduction histidine kinase
VSLRGRLVLVLAYVLVLAVASLLVPLIRSVRDRVAAEVRTTALGQAEVVAATAAGGGDPRRLVETSAEQVRGRVLIVDGRGVVTADSANSSVGARYGERPEIATALGGKIAQQTRASQTLGRRILATAVPIVRAGRVRGAVRVTQSVAAVDHAVNSATAGLVLIGAVVLGLGLLAGVLLAGNLARPLHRLARAARRAGDGDLGVRVPEEGSSEQREVARAFNEMTSRVQRMVDAQRDFVADASHQLRTPLTGLRLRLEEAAATTGDVAAREQLDAAVGEVDRLSGVVTELLVLSEAGAARAPEAAADPLAAARRAAERWAAHGADISVVGADAGTVRCAVADLDRILDVLVENAIDYGPPGQRVALTVAPGRVEVADEGRGLAPGEEEAVFARFHRGSAGRAGGSGTGLGLAIARELAARWEGSVALANRSEGPGAVAIVVLPIAALPEPAGARR